jgi:hypothetical protein
MTELGAFTKTSMVAQQQQKFSHHIDIVTPSFTQNESLIHESDGYADFCYMLNVLLYK